MGVIVTEPPLADVIGLPLYIVDSVIRRDLGSGLASILNCRTINGVCVPVCEIVISAQHILTLANSGRDFALEIQRKMQIAPLHRLRMDGPSH